MKKETRTTIRIARLVVMVGVVTFLAGCSGGVEVSMSDRIKDFVDAINDEEYTDIRSLCDDRAEFYDNANTEAYWTQYFGSPGAYEVSDIDEGGSSATALISGGEWLTGTTFTFSFSEEEGGLFEGSTFYIRKIETANQVIFE